MIESKNIPFQERRRQKFLDENYYIFLKEWDPAHTIQDIEGALSSSNLSPEMRALERLRKADEMFEMFSRDYTAGGPLTELRDSLQPVVEAYLEAADERRRYEGEPAMPLFDFKNIDDYVRLTALLSLAILLHREDLIAPVHSLFKGGAPDEADALVEELLGHYLPNRPVLDTWFHELPYAYLLDATAETPMKEKQQDIKEYLKAWYPGMRGAGWYNSHKNQSPRGAGGYFGYWAFEAAAISYLYSVDDAPFRDHLVYPKDLADFARSMPNGSATDIQAERLRCKAGDPCPQAGWWFTPAMEGSRRHFESGALMPVFGGSYGETIWQRDINQNQ
jgi:hypothetical protein